MTEANALHALLEVQAHDTKLDQLRHQLAVLPERAAREQAAAAVAEAEQRIAAVGAERAELAREQKRIDDEVELLRDKRDGFDKKLYGGTVSNPRELQDLQEEIDALGRRIVHLEDTELEVMEQVEPLDASLAELAQVAEQGRAALADAEERLVTASAELDGAIAAENDERTAAAAAIEPGLVAHYDQLRSGLGGVGIARLVGSQCGGCHLGLSAMEVARIRKLPPGELVHCEECGRILVP
jgi:uncharacterized protein